MGAPAGTGANVSLVEESLASLDKKGFLSPTFLS